MANETKYYLYPFADQGNREDVEDVSVGGLVGYDQGYGPFYSLAQGETNRKTIGRTRFNELLFGVTENLKQWQENNYPTWIEDIGDGSSFEYGANTIVNHDSLKWVALEDTDAEPTTEAPAWRRYEPSKSLNVSGDGGELTQTLTEVQESLDGNARREFTLIASNIDSNGIATLSQDWDSFEELIFDYAGTTSGFNRTQLTFFTSLIDGSDSTSTMNYSLSANNDVGCELNFRDTNKDELYFTSLGNNDVIVAIYGRYPI